MTQHRFTNRSVDRFVPILRQVIASPSTPVFIIDAAKMGLSRETVAARLRDAVNAILDFKVAYADVVPEQLQRVWEGRFVTIKEHGVEIRRADAPPDATGPVIADAMSIPNEGLVTNRRDSRTLSSIVHLLSIKVIEGPVRILPAQTDLNLDAFFTLLQTAGEDFIFQTEPDGSIVLF